MKKKVTKHGLQFCQLAQLPSTVTISHVHESDWCQFYLYVIISPFQENTTFKSEQSAPTNHFNLPINMFCSGVNNFSKLKNWISQVAINARAYLDNLDYVCSSAHPFSPPSILLLHGQVLDLNSSWFLSHYHVCHRLQSTDSSFASWPSCHQL